MQPTRTSPTLDFVPRDDKLADVVYRSTIETLEEEACWITD